MEKKGQNIRLRENINSTFWLVKVLTDNEGTESEHLDTGDDFDENGIERIEILGTSSVVSSDGKTEFINMDIELVNYQTLIEVDFVVVKLIDQITKK